jgi:DNA-binding NarL/FixJ family response regulator
MPIKLTKRQSEAVKHKANGLAVPRIAQIMGVSHKTVEAHLCTAMSRLKCKSWGELIDNCQTIRWRNA